MLVIDGPCLAGVFDFGVTKMLRCCDISNVRRIMVFGAVSILNGNTVWMLAAGSMAVAICCNMLHLRTCWCVQSCISGACAD